MRLYLALGSNVGDRLANLRFARSEVIRLILAGPLDAAGIYESAPVDCPPGSPAFLNTVIAGSTDLSAERIHALTQAIETAAGRARTAIRNAPRCLDVDILLLGDLVIHTATLTIPHPRLHLRRFVLHPLAELSPHLVIPGLDRSVSQLCTAFAGTESPPVRLASCW